MGDRWRECIVHGAILGSAMVVIALGYLMLAQFVWGLHLTFPQPHLTDWLTLDITPTISVVEVLWTLPALLGCIRYLDRYIRARRVRSQYQAEGINGVYRLRTDIRCLRSLFLTVAFEAMLVTGLMAMMWPPAPPSPPEMPETWITPLCFFMIEGALLISGEVVDRYENALVRLYEVKQVAETEHRYRARPGD